MPNLKPDVTDREGIFALNLTIIHPSNLSYRSLLWLISCYRQASSGAFPDFIEFTPEVMQLFLESIGGEGEDGDEFLGIKCLIEPESVESHNVKRTQ